MKLSKIRAAYKDERGEIIDILERVEIDCVTLITSVKGARRGNHYHKESDQYVYVLSGRIKVLTQTPDGEVEETIIQSGDLVYTPPFEKHAFVAVEDSVFLALTKGPRGGTAYESDTFRLSKPIMKKELISDTS